MRTRYNPERRVWRGRSHKRGGVTGRDVKRVGVSIRELREDVPDKGERGDPAEETP